MSTPSAGAAPDENKTPTTDSSNSQGSFSAPSGALTPAPQYGQPSGTPQYGQPSGTPQYGQPSGMPVPPGGPAYGPPPSGFKNFNSAFKPGIVPLRPLSLGEIYDGAFRALRKAPGTTLGLTSIIVGFFVVIAVIIGYVLTPWLNSTQLMQDINKLMASEPSIDVTGLAGSFSISAIISFMLPVATVFVTAVVVVAIGNLVISSKVSASETWVRVSGRIGPLFGIFALTSLLPGILAFGVIIGGAWVISTTSSAEGAIGFSALLTIVVGLTWVYFQVRWVFASSSLILEEQRPIEAIKRSMALTKGSFWRIVGYYILTTTILSVAVGMVFGVIEVVVQLIMGTETLMTSWYGLTIYAVLQTLQQTVIVGALSAVITLLYIDIRMRREGLDIELIAAAQKQ